MEHVVMLGTDEEPMLRDAGEDREADTLYMLKVFAGSAASGLLFGVAVSIASITSDADPLGLRGQVASGVVRIVLPPAESAPKPGFSLL
jgi:hypothetical protein